MNELFRIATQISTPLALAGLICAMLFLIARQVISSKFIPRLKPSQGFLLLTRIVNAMFVLSLCGMIAGALSWLIVRSMASRNPDQALISIDRHSVIIASNVTLLLANGAQADISLATVIELAAKFEVHTNILAYELRSLGQTNFTEADLVNFGRSLAERAKAALSELDHWNPRTPVEQEAKKRAQQALRLGQLTVTEQILRNFKLPSDSVKNGSPKENSGFVDTTPKRLEHGADIFLNMGAAEVDADLIEIQSRDDFGDSIIITSVTALLGNSEGSRSWTSNFLVKPITLKHFGDSIRFTNRLGDWSTNGIRLRFVAAFAEGIDRHDGTNGSNQEDIFHLSFDP